MHSFDKIIDRVGTQSIKFDSAAQRGKPSDVFPMWVADMDFRSPDCVIEALEQRVQHGIFGYSDTNAAYDETLVGWFAARHGWKISAKWNVVTGSIVPSLYMAVRAFTDESDGVIVQPPVYYPFFGAIREQGRTILENPLVLKKGRYKIDFDGFEQLAKRAKLFILCSPHNPVGRVWTREELSRLGGICLRHGVTVVSDEIHADFVYGKSTHTHTPFASIDARFADICATCTSPSKTFNLAGLQLANVIIPNEGLRRKFTAEYARTGLSQGSLLGMTACRAAYEGGQPWLDRLLRYLSGNIAVVRDYFKGSKINLIEPEGTYLLWLDCRAMELTDAQLDAKFLKEYKLWLDAGTMFGGGSNAGSGFMRMNIALPREKLRECLERIK